MCFTKRKTRELFDRFSYCFNIFIDTRENYEKNSKITLILFFCWTTTV